MGQQKQQGTMFTGVVYATAAAQLMKTIYVSRAHQVTDIRHWPEVSDFVAHFCTLQ